MLLARTPAEHLQRHEELLVAGAKWIDSTLVKKNAKGRAINDSRADHLALYIISKNTSNPLNALNVVHLLQKNGKAAPGTAANNKSSSQGSGGNSTTKGKAVQLRC